MRPQVSQTVSTMAATRIEARNTLNGYAWSKGANFESQLKELPLLVVPSG